MSDESQAGRSAGEARLESYERIGELDIRKHLKIYFGADDKRSLIDATKEYVKLHYPYAYTKAFSLPEEYILNKRSFNKLHQTARKGKEDVDMPSDERSVAMVFDEVKKAFKDVPSLTVCDYAFTDTFLKGINQQQKKKFTSFVDLPRNPFQLFSENEAQMKKLLVILSPKQRELVNSTEKVILICGGPGTGKTLVVKKRAEKLAENSAVLLINMAGGFLTEEFRCDFEVNPLRSAYRVNLKRQLYKLSVTRAVFNNLDMATSAENFRFNAFTWFKLGIAAAACYRELVPVRPRSTQTPELLETVQELVVEDCLVTTRELDEWLDVGKSTVHEVLTQDLQLHNKASVWVPHRLSEDNKADRINGNEKIEILDGRDTDLQLDLGELIKFLLERGKEKHVLLDEVPITLGFQGVLYSETLSNHWKQIVDMSPHVKSVTVSFRPNDQSYTRDFLLQEVKPGGYQIEVLEGVKRNSRNIAELFLAIMDYSRHTFTSLERTFPIDMRVSEREFLPVLFPIPSCFSLHAGHCRDKNICEAVRASYAISIIYEECSQSLNNLPIFVVVDSYERWNALVKILIFSFDSLPVHFHDSGSYWGGKGITIRESFRGKQVPDGSVPIVVVTQDEIMGCHLKNKTVILDFPDSQWKNYIRLIVPNGENMIVVLEEEELRTGKFSRILKEVSQWNKGKLDEKDLHRRLEMAWLKFTDEEISRIMDGLDSASFPSLEMDRDEYIEADVAHVKKMSECWLTGIFGYPGSGKSRKVCQLIRQVMEQKGQFFILHCGSTLAVGAYRRSLGTMATLEIDKIGSSDVNSLQAIFKRTEKILKEKREKNVLGMEEEGKESDPVVVVVEDCPLLKELHGATTKLKAMNMRLILVFKPHSREVSRDKVDETIKVLNENQDSTAIVLQSQPINVHLLKHIQENETRTTLNLEAKSLPVSSVPAAIVLGPVVRYFKCSGLHLGYICKGKDKCFKSVAVASALRLAALSKKIERAASRSRKLAHILVSDEDLLRSLESLNSSPDVQVVHPNDFRGCETSGVISVNVSDDWLLEVISRSRTQLIIIDIIPDHNDLWKTMSREEHVQVWDGPSPIDFEAQPGIVLKLDEKERFLGEPTWNNAGERIGEEAVRKELIDPKTGTILCLPPETWETLNDTLLLPSSSSPFADWGYAWDGCEAEVPHVNDDNQRAIFEMLKEKGVKWEPEQRPPVALKGQSNGVGFLESLSLTFTGSLLHLPLLKKILVDDDPGDPLSQVNLAVEILRRPIVLIGKERSDVFLPKERHEKGELRGILLFCENHSSALTIFPIVPHRNKLESEEKEYILEDLGASQYEMKVYESLPEGSKFNTLDHRLPTPRKGRILRYFDKNLRYESRILERCFNELGEHNTLILLERFGEEDKFPAHHNI
ncbi:unnamed protein product [Darwinula stevensoni]|uniref:Uncharacterized protein n=1 Tax=Darwinula stevensoni TaxID=69355 RepID=A0A7R8X7X9_9CRUS|nr:unnamed protein product [Darwinula stevensoni]CAG0882781.1 unnamed protein product [Darwinula stevensoni]